MIRAELGAQVKRVPVARMVRRHRAWLVRAARAVQEAGTAAVRQVAAVRRAAVGQRFAMRRIVPMVAAKTTSATLELLTFYAELAGNCVKIAPRQTDPAPIMPASTCLNAIRRRVLVVVA